MNVLAKHFCRYSISSLVVLSSSSKSFAMAKERPKDIFGFTVKDIEGKDVDLSIYKGYVSLIVNVASA